MQSIFEIFHEEGPLDSKLFLHKVNSYPLHWHQVHELLLILEGQANITIGDKTHTYKENDLVLINAYEPHQISSTDGVVMLALQINLALSNEKAYFDVDSYENPGNEYEEIKRIMAYMIKLNNEAAPKYELLIQSLLLRLQYNLYTHYKIDSEKENTEQYAKQLLKLRDILEYIQENYRSQISLNSVAEKFFYSPSYLSRVFEKSMGITFKKYIDNLRLTYAMNLLMSTNNSIDDIAIESGFPNTRSFVAIHKNIYGCLPSNHRKNKSVSSSEKNKKSDNYILIQKTDYFSKLAPYLLDKKQDVFEQMTETSEQIEKISIEVDSNHIEKQLRHTFKNFCSVGRASDILKQNIRDMLVEMQKEIGFRYIKFHGILDDDMGVYCKTNDNRIVINYDSIDNIIDFLLSIQLKPLMQLSFMPKALAKYPNKTTFYKPTITSEPNNMKNWTNFIEKLVSHLIIRYGVQEVETWPFCLWNEFETPSEIFGLNDPSFVKTFYHETYKTVKKICPSVKFGTTSMMTSTILNEKNLRNMLESVYLTDSNTLPDFINIHFYPVSNLLKFNPDNIFIGGKLEKNPHIMSETIQDLKKTLQEYKLDNLPIYLTEWNSTTSHRDLINDTAFKGAYIARNIIENYDELDSFGYWALTDDLLELAPENKLFHGGIGLFTKSGIKKPPYYAYYFLSQLGKNLIYKDNNNILTSDFRGYQAVLTNYIHYNDLYAAGELYNTTMSNRYVAFRDEKKKSIHMVLKNVANGNYIIEEYIVNRNSGSCFDVWAERFNNEEPITPEAMNALKYASYPKYCIKNIKVENKKLIYEANLEPYEIRLIKIKKI